MKKIRLLTYNIHKGFHWNGVQQMLLSIKKAIKITKADVVCLQEVVGEHTSKSFLTHLGAQFEILSDGLWPHMAYGKNAVYSRGHHGNAILSHYPIIETHNYDLTLHSWEQRGLLRATLDLGHHIHLPIYNTHINLRSSDRQAQLQIIGRIINEMHAEEDAFILCGDFNDWDQKAGASLTSLIPPIQEIFWHLQGQHALSFPSFWPVLSLDRIYYRHLNPLHAEVMQGKFWRHLSDHNALYAEFTYPTSIK